MENYKRLTDKDIAVTLNCNAYEDNTRFFNYAHRLWELENAIENYELITPIEQSKYTAKTLVGICCNILSEAFDIPNVLIYDFMRSKLKEKGIHIE